MYGWADYYLDGIAKVGQENINYSLGLINILLI